MKKPKPRIDNRTRLGPLALGLIDEMCGKGAPTQQRLDEAIRILRERNKRALDLNGVESSLGALRDEHWETSQRLLNGVNLIRYLLEGLTDSVRGAELGDVIAHLNDKADVHVKPVKESRAEVEKGIYRPNY